jgi:hypothetical protein
VREKAARRGQAIEEYLLSLAQRDAAAADTIPDQPVEEENDEDTMPWTEVIRRIQTGYQPTPEERDRALQKFCEGLNIGAALTDEDLRRENMYEDRF